jgi:hypothetical protein
MPKFMLLMREDDHAWARLPPEERRRLLPLYFAWVRKLREQDLLRGGEALAEGGRILRSAGGQVIDEPCEETLGVPTGFFLIEAPGMDAAVRIARECPALTHGETVLVREVTDHSGDT